MKTLEVFALTIALLSLTTLLGIALCSFIGVTLWAAPLVGTTFLGGLAYLNN